MATMRRSRSRGTLFLLGDAVLMMVLLMLVSAGLVPFSWDHAPVPGQPPAQDAPFDAGDDIGPVGPGGWKAYPYESPPFKLPDDEGAHPEASSEWWYVNGHLMSADGDRYEFMVCFFARGVLTAELFDVSEGRFINTSEHFTSVVKETGRLGLVFGESSFHQVEGEPFVYMLSYSSPEFSLELRFEALKEPLLINGDGIVRMGEGVSYYYSLTDMSAEGTLSMGRHDTDVSGEAWMDRQWGGWSPEVDWDWSSISLDNGMQVLLYRITMGGPSDRVDLMVSVIDADGNTFHAMRSGDRFSVVLDIEGYWRSPTTRSLYSQGWALTVPDLGLRLTITPLMPEQEVLFPSDEAAPLWFRSFWEGACEVSGTLDGRQVSGRAFTETTHDHGYVRGDLVIDQMRCRREGNHLELVVNVENTAGYALNELELVISHGSPYDGGEIIGYRDLVRADNSTRIITSVPDTGDGMVYVMVDPGNTVPETDEGNNLAMAEPS